MTHKNEQIRTFHVGFGPLLLMIITIFSVSMMLGSLIISKEPMVIQSIYIYGFTLGGIILILALALVFLKDGSIVLRRNRD